MSDIHMLSELKFLSKTNVMHYVKADGFALNLRLPLPVFVACHQAH